MTINSFLQQFFGAGATQSSTDLIIKKSSLLGLTPSSINTAESLLIGILLTALDSMQGGLSDESGSNITDQSGEPISYDNSDLYEFIKIIRWKPSYSERNKMIYILNQIILINYVPN